MRFTYEELKSMAVGACIGLYKTIKPQDVSNMPKEAQLLWKIGWELSAQRLEKPT